jgi:hypothetical protein
MDRLPLWQRDGSRGEEMTVKASFQWSPEKGDYVGPEGDDALPFKRMRRSDAP